MKEMVILSHQGGSFIGKLADACQATGLGHRIISSSPSNEDLRSALARRGNVDIVEGANLNIDTVTPLCRRMAQENTLAGVISVWEGYRPLMAALNNQFGFSDISEETALFLRDKLRVRYRLLEAGLSSVKVEIADSKNLGRRASGITRSFIKPRYGLGSIGAKEFVGRSEDMDYIQRMQKDLVKDELYGKAVGQGEFIVEDYIPGQELSAEIVVDAGQTSVLAFHEKVELVHGIFTTTEPFCVSPPQLAFDETSAREWLHSVQSVLGADYGCYHVEFKITPSGSFEIIEVNPRVGGALIVESTNYAANTDILASWIASIAGLPLEIADTAHPASSTPTVRTGNHEAVEEGTRFTAFRVYFSELTGTVDSIIKKDCAPKPVSFDQLIDVGDKLTREGSEQYLAQAMWTGTAGTRKVVRSLQREVQNMSREFIRYDIRPTPAKREAFLIVDYNLNRRDEVVRLAEKCHATHGIETVLLTEPGKEIRHPLVTNITAESIRSESFIKDCVRALLDKGLHCKAGLVFSDDAVVTGSRILSHMGLRTDSPELAVRAFDKMDYREAESLLDMPPGVARPGYANPACLSGAEMGESAKWVVKPRCEGNNRGVVVVSSADDANAALDAHPQYLEQGFIAETLICGKSEYSVDGVGAVRFITQKLALKGDHPVEIGQIQPAILNAKDEERVLAANEVANRLTGVETGAFHNEVMISSDTGEAFIIEPNRRPGGMRIWDLIGKAYGVDLYDVWIRSAFGKVPPERNIDDYIQSAGFLMLTGPRGLSVKHGGIEEGLDQLVESVWNSVGVLEPRPIHHDLTFIAEEGFVFPDHPVDGHSFMLSLCFTASPETDLKELLYSFYQEWDRIVHNDPFVAACSSKGADQSQEDQEPAHRGSRKEMAISTDREPADA